MDHGVVAKCPSRELGAWPHQSLVLSSQCDVLVEEFEEVIEDWYRNHQEEDLTEFLCANHVLKGKDTSELGQEEAGWCLSSAVPRGRSRTWGREVEGILTQGY